MEQLKLMVCFVYKHSHSRWFLKFHVGDDGARICFAFHCASPVVGRLGAICVEIDGFGRWRENILLSFFLRIVLPSSLR